ncbi:BA75_05227T0 [Komagataella pastoris]|uniref:BA75_05227T0 n=1 Tax=Komagataella pastoris TaxID=4922 RepID=A0A1B2JI58_PICPA|nr:BA75_05227T0 [Komagataella pastoris]
MVYLSAWDTAHSFLLQTTYTDVGMIPVREPYYPPGGMEIPASMDAIQPHINIPNATPPQQEQIQGPPPLRRHNMVQYQLNTNLKRQLSNFTLLKFLEFCELAGARSKLHDKEYWQKVSEDYFTPEGTVSFVLKKDNKSSGTPNGGHDAAPDLRHFEMLTSLIPQFVSGWIGPGVESVDIFPLLIKVEILANGSTYIESRKFCIKYTFRNGSHFDVTGIARVVYNQQLKIDLFEFQDVETSRAVDLKSLYTTFEKCLRRSTKENGKAMTVNGSDTESQLNIPFNMQEEVLGNEQSSMIKMIADEVLCASGQNTLDMDKKFHSLLQLYDTFSIMSTLVEFSTANGIASPLESLDTFLNLNKHILKESSGPPAKRPRT